MGKRNRRIKKSVSSYTKKEKESLEILLNTFEDLFGGEVGSYKGLEK